MRLFVFNCLLLASVAVALPDGRHKRDLAFLKNLITSAIFGRSQINILVEPEPEENGYKLFGLPGYDDVMIRVAPKKPVVEEFVYPPAVETVNLNAFGTVVGTKSKDDTLVAVNEVNNLLSTGILYGGQNNVMKETVVPMFPSLNTPNYFVEERIKTAPVIETRPVLTEVIETRPVLTEVVETGPVLTEVVETRPVLTEVVETGPVLTEVVETRPVLTEVVETGPVLTQLVETRPVLTEVVETRPVLTELVETRPVFTEVIRPVEEKVELIVPFEPKYSYKQIQNNVPVMTYTAHYNPGVETVKTKTELPMCIKNRVDEAILLGADPNRFAPVQEVFQYQRPPLVDFSNPRVEANAFVQNSFREEVAPVQEVFQYQSLPVVDFSYPRVEANAYLQNTFREEVASAQEVHQFQSPSFVDFSYPRVEANSYVQNSFRKELTKEPDVTNGFGLTSQRLRPSKDSLVRYNLRPTMTEAINPRPNPLHSQKPLHFEEDNISTSKDKVNPTTRKVLQAFNNLGEKDVSQTLGQYIAQVNNERGNSKVHGNRKQIKAVPIVGSKDNISNTKIPVNVYKSQSNPNIGKVVKESDALRINGKPNTNQYVNGPAVNIGTEKNETAQIKNVVYTKTSKVPAKPQRVKLPDVVASKNAPKQPLRENIQTSIIHKPTAIKGNKNYSYQQMNANGSSLNVNGNKYYGVSVSVKENNNRGRGDIPDQ